MTDLSAALAEATPAMRTWARASPTRQHPGEPARRQVVVSVRVANDLCLQKSKGTWSPSRRRSNPSSSTRPPLNRPGYRRPLSFGFAPRSAFRRQKRFTSLDGSAEHMGGAFSCLSPFPCRFCSLSLPR